MSGERNPRAAEIAYQAIAPVYDDFTAHHDYELWLGQLLPKVEAHGLEGKRLLDVGCGTGKSFIPMLERGWEVTACDISASMVELARAKVGERAALSVADMRELPVFGEFDLVFCLDDAVNYLFDVGELERALTGMRRNLAPTGLLMFDVNTLQTYRTFFTEEVEVERDGLRLRWHGRSTADAEPRSIAEASFEVEALDGEAGPGGRAACAPPAPLPRRGRLRGAGASRPGVPRRLRPWPRRDPTPAARRRRPRQGRLHRQGPAGRRGAGCPRGGCPRSSSRPAFSATRRERRLPGRISAATSASPSDPAHSTAAEAASVARPCPHRSGLTAQGSSTVDWPSISVQRRPPRPTTESSSRATRAQGPKPCSAQWRRSSPSISATSPVSNCFIGAGRSHSATAGSRKSLA